MKIQDYQIELSEQGFTVKWKNETVRFNCSIWIHSMELPDNPGALKPHPRGGIIRHSDNFSISSKLFDAPEIRNAATSFVFENETEEIQFAAVENAPGFAWRRVFRAVSEDKPTHIGRFIETVLMNAESPLYPSEKTFCFHAENARLYNRYCMGVLEDRTGRAGKPHDFYEKECDTFWGANRNFRKEIGRSPFQPFPAIIYSNHENNIAMMDATLTQNRLYRFYECQKTDTGYAYIWTQAPKTIKAVVLKPGEELYGEWNYFEFGEKNALNHPFTEYTAALENFNPGFRGEKSDNRDTMVWGSWNCGIFRNIDQDQILKTADYIEKNLPSVKWVQIDDGYDEWDYSLCRGRIGIGVAYKGEGASSEKFPGGMRHFTDEIKKRGIHPALWVGLHIATNRQPYLDHPEWFIPYGTDLGFGILDITRSDVREFITEAYRLFTQDWGFEGVKFDFWSYIFEEEIIPLPSGKITGTEYRTWYMKTIREMLPEHGYIQTGCDIAMANPHLGLYADNYRYGKDVGNGNWNNITTNARWAAFCVNTHTGHLFIPNSDSIGIMPGLGDTDTRTHVNFCLISRTLVEIAGWLHNDKDHPLMPFIMKACCCPKNGEDVFFGDFDFSATDDIPAIWYLKSPLFSRLKPDGLLPERTFAVFNWDDKQDKKFMITPETLGLKPDDYMAKDFWSDTTEDMQNLIIKLKPHESRLYNVFQSDMKAGVVDSNCLVQELTSHNGTLKIKALCAGENEIVLKGAPKHVKLNGIDLKSDHHQSLSKLSFAAQGTCLIEAEYRNPHEKR